MTKLDTENHRKLGKLPKALLCFGFILCGVISIFTIRQNINLFHDEQTATEGWILIFTLALLLLLVIAICRLRYDAAKWPLLFILLAVSLGIKIVFVFGPATPIESDFLALFQGAEKAAAGDFSWIRHGYFARWPYQVPFSMFEALLLKINPSFWILRIANLLFMQASNILVYFIVKKLASEKAALLAFVLYMIYPAPLLLGSVLTNQHGATAFFLLSVYLFLQGEHWRWSVFSALAAVMGDLFRTDTPVLLLAVFGVGFFVGLAWLWTREKKQLQIPRNTVIFLAVFMLCSKGISMTADVTGFCPGGFHNPYPQWKLLTGLNPDSKGQYTEADVEILQIQDPDAAWHETRQRIRGHLADTERWTFFQDKMEVMWAYKESYKWSFGYLDRTQEPVKGWTTETLLEKLTNYDKAVYILIWSLFLLSTIQQVIRLWGKNGTFHHGILYLTLIFFANYAAYVLIEVQTRYRYFVMPFMFVLAAMAADELLNANRPHAQAERDPLERNITVV